MKGGGYGQQMQGEKLDLQSVIFSILMRLNDTAATIWQFPDGYQTNASNYYYQVRSLIALVRPMLRQETIDAGNAVIDESIKKYNDLRDPNKHDALTGDKSDDVTDLVMFCAAQLLQVTCNDLLRQGFIREQARGAIAGVGVLLKEDDDEDVGDPEPMGDDE